MLGEELGDEAVCGRLRAPCIESEGLSGSVVVRGIDGAEGYPFRTLPARQPLRVRDPISAVRVYDVQIHENRVRGNLIVVGGNFAWHCNHRIEVRETQHLVSYPLSGSLVLVDD